MSTTIENSGTVSATIGAATIGTLLPDTITAGNTPVKLVTTMTGITSTSSSSPSFPDSASFTVTKAGVYRFHYLISVYVSKSSSSSGSSASSNFYFRYQITDSAGETREASIYSLSSSSSTTATIRTNYRNYIDITLAAGDTIRFGGYRSNSTYVSSSGATIYNLVAAIDWDNGF